MTDDARAQPDDNNGCRCPAWQTCPQCRDMKRPQVAGATTRLAAVPPPADTYESWLERFWPFIRHQAYCERFPRREGSCHCGLVELRKAWGERERAAVLPPASNR